MPVVPTGSIERWRDLAADARGRIGAARLMRVFVHGGDGFEGWDDDAPATLDDIERWTGDLANGWPELLESVDAHSMIHRVYPNGTVREVRAGVVLAQVLQHGNVHREQVCSILTQRGLSPPDLDVWEYAKAHGLDR